MSSSTNVRSLQACAERVGIQMTIYTPCYYDERNENAQRSLYRNPFENQYEVANRSFTYSRRGRVRLCTLYTSKNYSNGTRKRGVPFIRQLSRSAIRTQTKAK